MLRRSVFAVAVVVLIAGGGYYAFFYRSGVYTGAASMVSAHETFADCIARSVSSRNGLSLEERVMFRYRLEQAVDLNFLSRQVGERYTSQDLARDTETCLSKASPATARLDLSDVDERRGLWLSWKPSTPCGGLAGKTCLVSVGALMNRSLVLSKYDSSGGVSQTSLGFAEVYDLLAKPAEVASLKFHVTRSGNGARETPVVGAVVRLRAITASRNLVREGCTRAAKQPTVEQLWDGAEDPCLEARTNAEGEVTFVHDAAIVGYKLRITTDAAPGATRKDWIRSAEPGVRIPAVVEIRLEEDGDDLAAWEQPAPPGCGDAARWAKLLQTEEADGASQEKASVWVNKDGRLSEPDSVPPEIWRRVRHVRVATHEPCKPQRLKAL